MDAVEEIMCVVCVSVTKGHSGDGCDLASTVLFVLIVEGVSVVVNVMLSSNECDEPPPALCNMSVCTVVLGVFTLGVSLIF